MGHLLAHHLPLLMNMTALRRADWCGKCNRSLESMSNWPLSIRGYTGEHAAVATKQHGIQLEVVKHTEATRDCAPLPSRWVVERSFACAARFRRPARTDE